MKLALAVFSLIAAAGCSGVPERTLSLPEQVKRLEYNEPLKPEKLVSLLGVKPSCTPKAENGRIDCTTANFAFAGTRIKSLDYRGGQFGSLFILDIDAADCPDPEEFSRSFGAWRMGPGCTDGAICIYHTWDRSWGKLSIGLGNNPGKVDCIRSVILETRRT